MSLYKQTVTEVKYVNISDCGNLTVPDNAEMYLNNSKYSSRAVFFCKEGFTLHGDENRTCLETGSWSNDNPSCVIKGNKFCIILI